MAIYCVLAGERSQLGFSGFFAQTLARGCPPAAEICLTKQSKPRPASSGMRSLIRVCTVYFYVITFYTHYQVVKNTLFKF